LGYISPICPEAPHGRIFTKFCTAVDVVDVITRDKYFSDRLRDGWLAQCQEYCHYV